MPRIGRFASRAAAPPVCVVARPASRQRPDSIRPSKGLRPWAPGEIAERQDVPETWTVFRRPGGRDRGVLPCRLQLGGAPPEPEPKAVEPDAVRQLVGTRRSATWTPRLSE